MASLDRAEASMRRRIDELDVRMARIDSTAAMEKQRKPFSHHSQHFRQLSSKTLAASSSGNIPRRGGRDDDAEGNEELAHLSAALRDVRARYEAVKREFVRKLYDINQRKQVGHSLEVTEEGGLY
jgi:phage shock protein A